MSSPEERRKSTGRSMFAVVFPRIYPKGNKTVVKGVDTLLGTQVEVEADLVVLATAVTAAAGASELAEKLRISYDTYGFYVESHPKLTPGRNQYLRGVFGRGVSGTKRYSRLRRTGKCCRRQGAFPVLPGYAGV